MYFPVDENFLIDCFKEIVNTPSPVGFYTLFNPVLERYAAKLGHCVTYDRRGTPYITLEGEDNSKTVLIGAHADTLGMTLRKIEADGTIRVFPLGGVNFSCLEGETVTVHTRDNKSYTGLLVCQSHSVHIYEDSRTLERNEKTMMILLDQDVHSKEDVQALGICVGDYISVEPRCQFTENGYLKSRYIDNKGAIACCLTTLKYLCDNGRKPKYRTLLAFPYNEEIGLGGTYVPQDVSEYIAVDIGLVGGDFEGSERSVSIWARDNAGPYDLQLTNRLIAYAEKADCPYSIAVSNRYGSDAQAALRAGNDLRIAAFGMAVYGSHNVERTHITGLCGTVNILLAYLLDI